MRSILLGAERYPRETMLIGRILAGYGELEFELCMCLGAALGDADGALRVMFRSRGEEGRLLVADALMRKKYSAIGLKDHYETMLGAFRACRAIRNRYAHCHWWFDDDLGVFYTDLQDPASKSAETEAKFTFYHIDAPLLEQQEAYFVYAKDVLNFLSYEYEKRSKTGPSHSRTMPARLEQPPPHNPPERHPPPPRLGALQSPSQKP